MFECINFANGIFLEFTREYEWYQTEKFAVRADQIVAYKDYWLYLSNGDQYEVKESYDEIAEKLTEWHIRVCKDIESWARQNGRNK